jgi:hypothetical protein
VINAVVAALQDRPHALDAVGMCHAVNILLGAVVDRAVIVAVNASIGRMGISTEHRIIFDVRHHRILNRARIGIHCGLLTCGEGAEPMGVHGDGIFYALQKVVALAHDLTLATESRDQLAQSACRSLARMTEPFGMQLLFSLCYVRKN